MQSMKQGEGGARHWCAVVCVAALLSMHASHRLVLLNGWDDARSHGACLLTEAFACAPWVCRRKRRRRQARASKQLGGRVMADTDRAFSEGADVEQWQRWAVGPSGLGNDGSGRAGKR